jgi:hypothetical protein
MICAHAHSGEATVAAAALIGLLLRYRVVAFAPIGLAPEKIKFNCERTFWVELNGILICRLMFCALNFVSPGICRSRWRWSFIYLRFNGNFLFSA